MTNLDGDVIEIQYNPNLTQLLDALGIYWKTERPANGRAATMVVRLDAETDGRLEGAIGSLADLRWRYEPGRRLQLAFDLDGVCYG